MKNMIAVLLGMVVMLVTTSGALAARKGLNEDAFQELDDTGVFKYLGEYTPVASTDVGDGWTKHTFDTDGGNGPICIAGTSYSVFTRAGKSNKLLIVEQGGGACWQDFYNCNVLSESQEPPTGRVGIWDFDSKDNPFAKYSIVYMPYCDGSVHSGDNDVFDPAFGAAIGVPEAVIRFHRGLRNQSAGMDVAKAVFPDPDKVTVTGSSAGGVGAAGFAPFLVRALYGNNVHLTVLNDAGPVAINTDDTAAITARSNDWEFDKFYPASCTGCGEAGDPVQAGIALIDWRLNNDSSIREAFYSTDADATNRFFMKLLPPFGSQADYRDLLLSQHHAVLNGAHPDRYKNFIVSGDISHTALQSPLFYSQTVEGVPLNEWTRNFVSPRKPFWYDLVQYLIPAPF